MTSNTCKMLSAGQVQTTRVTIVTGFLQFYDVHVQILEGNFSNLFLKSELFVLYHCKGSGYIYIQLSFLSYPCQSGSKKRFNNLIKNKKRFWKACWYTPLISALEGQKQIRSLWVWGWLGLWNEFQTSQVDIVRPILKIKSKQKDFTGQRDGSVGPSLCGPSLSAINWIHRSLTDCPPQSTGTPWHGTPWHVHACRNTHTNTQK